MVWGGRMEEGSGWGTHVYLWQIHFDVWQNQYNIVKFKNKIKLKKKNSGLRSPSTVILEPKKTLDWVAIFYSRGSSQPRDQTCISYTSCLGRQVLYHWHHLGSPSVLWVMRIQ